MVKTINSTAKIFRSPKPILLGLSKGIYSGGPRRIRTFEGVSQQIYSLPQLTALVSTPKIVNPLLNKN